MRVSFYLSTVRRVKDVHLLITSFFDGRTNGHIENIMPRDVRNRFLFARQHTDARY